jgi:hypothetical protein
MTGDVTILEGSGRGIDDGEFTNYEHEALPGQSGPDVPLPDPGDGVPRSGGMKAEDDPLCDPGEHGIFEFGCMPIKYHSPLLPAGRDKIRHPRCSLRCILHSTHAGLVTGPHLLTPRRHCATASRHARDLRLLPNDQSFNQTRGPDRESAPLEQRPIQAPLSQHWERGRG